MTPRAQVLAELRASRERHALALQQHDRVSAEAERLAQDDLLDELAALIPGQRRQEEP